MNFSEAFKVAASQTITENGGKCFSSTGSDLLNLFATIGGLRSVPEDKIIEMYKAARDEDKELADNLVLYSRNIREDGCGERRVGKILLKTLAKLDPQKVNRNFTTIVNNGRWDDLFCLFDTPCEDKMMIYCLKQITEDINSFVEKKPVSLIAKWMPSVNTSSKETVKMAKKFCRFAGISEKDYRKTLSGLRSYLNVTEKLMSAKKWDLIDFETVPSVAMNRYMNAFSKNCGEKWFKYRESVISGEKKINAATLFPYDIVRPIFNNLYDWTGTGYDDELLNEQWKALPNYLKNNEEVVCMCDVSGSMFCDDCRPISTSIGLGIYFAQHNQGTYHNMYMSFSSRPSFITIEDGQNISDIVNKMTKTGIGYSTNLDAGFEAIYKVAVKTNDVPKALIVISDMEIDSYKDDSFSIADKWEQKFKEAGLIMPKLILWNVESRKGDTFLSTKYNPNVAFISGQSAATFSHLQTLIEKDAYSAMVEILSLPQFQWA